MAVKWTDEQNKIIDSRTQNLLVAAAAGSGKTAVLVEHIVQMILDPVDPCNVNELLVVTFTRAAAAEMKERIRLRMEQEMLEHPELVNLRKQIALLDQAHICTTDSFCSWLVKNYFYRLDIDPDFRILDETERKLLSADVMDQLLEDKYLEGEAKYIHLMDAYTSDKDDSAVRDKIQKIVRMADAMPWPEEWIGSLAYAKKAEQFQDLAWTTPLEEKLKREVSQWQELVLWAKKTCNEYQWLEPYRDMFHLDSQAIDEILQADDLIERMKKLSQLAFVKKPVISKKKIEDPQLKDSLSALRDTVKNGFKKLTEKYQMEDAEAVLMAVNQTVDDRNTLADLALEFYRRYQQAKKDKNVAEFGDVAHNALRLLLDYKDGKETPTELADELADGFREIIVDEYQDSNLIQEKLYLALSGDRFGKPNMFMVGDVKQSIYKFRMARPELFMDKYGRYSYRDHETPGCKIDLGKNFRSRAMILNEANTVFEQIMSMEYGGIAYDSHAKLYHGNMDYPEGDPEPELLIAVDDTGGAEPQEVEGRLIAAKIREMMDPEDPYMIWDGKKNEMRPVRYSDIVILLRTLEGWAEEIQLVLNQHDVPAYTEQKTGYFQAQEIQVLLSLLRVIDNPLQDIPLATVLHSVYGGFTDEELAEIAAMTEKDDLYNRCVRAAEGGICTEKWNEFSAMLERYRKQAVYLSIPELLEFLLKDRHYDRILASSMDGAVCMANVEMLIEKARAYEETMFHGVFHFLRYMDKLRTYKVDFGEAQVLSESEDLVRITSIHKSKGLEYPVVFVGGMNKDFNFKDPQEVFLVDEKMGVVCDYVDVDRRTKQLLPNKKYISEKMCDEIRQEEMRILYVALTRAKERLICTGMIRPSKTKPDPLAENVVLGTVWRGIQSAMGGEAKRSFPGVFVSGCTSYLDWMALTVIDNSEASWKVTRTSVKELMAEEVFTQGSEELIKNLWLKDGFIDVPLEEVCDQYRRAKDWKYEHQRATMQKSVVSVSELKHAAAEKYLESQEHSVVEGQNRKQREKYEQGENLGAKRGTAYHLIFEKIPAGKIHTLADVTQEVDRLVREDLLDPEMRDIIDDEKILRFYRSELGIKMAAAEAEGRLYKEQPFVMGEYLGNGEDAEFVLVQGIIDAFLVQGDEIILWDYKTDRVPKEGAAKHLVGLYKEQLIQYKHAIERARGQRVREIWIYSVTMDAMIPVTEDEVKQ